MLVIMIMVMFMSMVGHYTKSKDRAKDDDPYHNWTPSQHVQYDLSHATLDARLPM